MSCLEDVTGRLPILLEVVIRAATGLTPMALGSGFFDNLLDAFYKCQEITAMADSVAQFAQKQCEKLHSSPRLIT